MYYNSFYTVDPFNPKLIEFDVWSEEEVAKLSVVKINTYIVFDALGYPVPGGLYDSRLGPLKFNSDPCATCGNNLMKCLGHYGHIELPLPVFNPLFTAVVANILKSSCLNCFTFQVPDGTKHVRIAQLKLIEEGHLIEPYQLDEFLEEASYKQTDQIKKEVDMLVEKTISSHATNLCKNADDVWRCYVTKIFREASTMKVCFNCKKKINKVRLYRGRLFIDSGKTKKFLMPETAREHLRALWQNESELLKTLVKSLSRNEKYPTDLCFTSRILVTPSNTRPVNIVNQKPVEHSKNSMYRLILQDCLQIRSIVRVMKKDETKQVISKEVEDVVAAYRGDKIEEKLYNAWHSLQISVNSLLDADALKGVMKASAGTAKIGLKQLIEKKAGILRMNMMGKRVDFFARSVVTPDPMLNINEIGVPDAFAKKLTFPVPVTSWNVKELRNLVKNGPLKYPGANIVESDDGAVVWISATNAASREGLAKTLLTPGLDSRSPKVVHRHLQDGDMLLINRQPSLHKPSIMAHKARVLKGEKTFRLHYANCKAYNADFDGDEVNAHFPQSELARAEASEIVNSANQYLVPRDGTPLSGLIQDHVIAGFRLTLRGKFLDRLQYHQFVFEAIGFLVKDIKTLPPTILKPKRLWSGKQVISTIIINLTPEGTVPLNMNSKIKLGFNAWPRASTECECMTPEEVKFMSETNFVIRRGELMSGVLDKNHVGATHYGLVHNFYELYGGQYSANLLSAFSKLFTCYQQKHGFTLGVLDILVKKKPDRKRSMIAEQTKVAGVKAAKKALDVPPEQEVDQAQLDRMLEIAYKKNSNFRALIDREYKTVLDQRTNDINKICLPAGLLQPFPDNNLQLMVQSGAKGSTVNTMQISCLLGQIELEGKRPPLMISGKSLPSYRPYDAAPIAGGFIVSRFMTGIQPQEFFFHCMAGREGLIDTAVKTSRSGYLQRCLVKHLEGLVVNYDLTVRDSDNSVIQFQYGEDGLDILKAQLLKPDQMKFFSDNIDTFRNKTEMKQLKKETTAGVKERKAVIDRYRKEYDGKLMKSLHRTSGFLKFCEEVANDSLKIKVKNNLPGRTLAASNLCYFWHSVLDEETRRTYMPPLRCADPVTADFKPDTHFGAVSEVIEGMIDDYIKKNKHDPSFKKSKFKDVVYWKLFNSICQPGEAVGVLAAQSVGEPSTQMTLNTFHFAGRGEMNVTLGIPRLREILMVASKRIKTPSMEIPFRTDVLRVEKKAERLRKSLTKIVLKDVLEKIDVKEGISLKGDHTRTYDLHLHYLPRRAYSNMTNLKPQQILKYVETVFLSKLKAAFKKSLKSSCSTGLVMGDNRSSKKQEKDDDEDNTVVEDAVNDESDVDSDVDGDGDATEVKRKNRGTELEYDDENEDIEEEDDDDCENTPVKRPANSDDESSDHENDGFNQKKSQEDSDGLNQKKSQEDSSDSEETDEEATISLNQIFDTSNYSINKKGPSIAEKFGVKRITHDIENSLWSRVVLWVSLSYKRIDLSNLLPTVVENAVIHEVTGIKRAITYTNNEGLLTLKTEGSYGLAELFRHDQLLDLNKLYSNDVHAVAQSFGIEAANRVIVKEIQDVFNVYGITVDPRHLSLIADYMTFDGTYQPLNRTGMDNCPSPLQQMTFESTLKYLRNATIRYSGEEEDVSCMSYDFRNHPEIDESLVSQGPGDAITGERMTIRRFAELADSVHVDPRQSVARRILEVLQLAVISVEAYSEQDDVEKVFAYINKLSQDSETIVRCNLLNALPKVASFCAEYDSPLVALKELVESDILPIVLKAIADEDKSCNMKVRKDGYSVLKYLLNNNLVSEQSIENKICDLCKGLLFHPNDIINIVTAGNFIVRMAPIVGEATTEKLLLPKISELCSNQHAKVREACAFFLADLACYVNPLVTENIIIPLFIKLSGDDIWSVRHACAETAVILSCLCLMETRRTVLSRVFLSLLKDPQNSVSSAACKQLGPFITTFAQPAIMALGSNRSGDFLLIHYKGSNFEFLSRRSLFQFYEQPEENPFCMFMLPMQLEMDNAPSTSVVSSLKHYDLEEKNECTTNIDSTAENTIVSLFYRDDATTTTAPASSPADEPANQEPRLVGEVTEQAKEVVQKDNLSPSSGDNEDKKKRGNDTSDQFCNQPDIVQSCRRSKSQSVLSDRFKLGVAESYRSRRRSLKNSAESFDHYNSFQFWRDPIPEFDLGDISTKNNDSRGKPVGENMSVLGGPIKENCGTARDGRWGHLDSDSDSDSDLENMENEAVNNCSTSSNNNVRYDFKLPSLLRPRQNVLPQRLLDEFISISETMPFDNRMNCAYTFPAIVLTLGTSNWFLLKNTYMELAMDTERKVRQLMASSIHEIASILGPELATKDLIPIYNSLINDVEEVRITALNHLSCFVKLLKPYGRCQFLPHLTEYMMTDSTWNWRFRQRLSEQLIEMMDFFAPSDCWKYVSPVALNLLVDRVSEVRLQALSLVTNLIRVVSPDITILRNILAELAEQFAHSTQWARRQSFALLCSSLLKTPVLPDDMFARDVLPHLLDLSWDPIPNVRIAVARTVSIDVITYPYFSNIFSPHYDVLTQVLKRLCKDKDRDVRHFASLNTSDVYERAYEKAERW